MYNFVYSGCLSVLCYIATSFFSFVVLHIVAPTLFKDSVIVTNEMDGENLGKREKD